jgi:hypothetical protein
MTASFSILCVTLSGLEFDRNAWGKWTHKLTVSLTDQGSCGLRRKDTRNCTRITSNYAVSSRPDHNYLGPREVKERREEQIITTITAICQDAALLHCAMQSAVAPITIIGGLKK